MTAPARPLCPVCRNTVLPNHNDRIKSHRDKAGGMCPAVGEHIDITREDL